MKIYFYIKEHSIAITPLEWHLIPNKHKYKSVTAYSFLFFYITIKND